MRTKPLVLCLLVACSHEHPLPAVSAPIEPEPVASIQTVSGAGWTFDVPAGYRMTSYLPEASSAVSTETYHGRPIEVSVGVTAASDALNESYHVVVQPTNVKLAGHRGMLTVYGTADKKLGFHLVKVSVLGLRFSLKCQGSKEAPLGLALRCLDVLKRFQSP